MLVCESKEVADRVAALKRTSFGAFQVFWDVWTREAGRTRFEQKHEAGWIVANGIPLHIRSPELFRQVGERCGGFVEFDVQGCPLSSVRVKVADLRVLPEVVEVQFRDEVFAIRITREKMGLWAKTAEACEGKGKGVSPGEFERGVCFKGYEYLAEEVRVQDPSSSEQAGVVQSGTSSEMEGTWDRGAENCTEGQRKEPNRLLHKDLGSGSCRTLLRVSEEFGNDRSGCNILGSSFANLSVDRGYAGFLLRKDVGLCIVQSDSIGSKAKELVCFWSSQGVGPGFGERKDQRSGPGGQWVFKIPLNAFWMEKGSLGLCKPISLNFGMELADLSEVGNGVVLKDFDEIEGSEGDVIELTPDRSSVDEEVELDSEELEEMVTVTEKVAGVLKLQVDPNQEEVESVIRRTAEAVLRRRNTRPKKSRTERELSRLGSSVEKVAEASVLSRRSGKSNAIPFPNVD
ncbi:hypothetical protein LINPERPRIM_LOCUS8376 [Linum perenne]